MYLIYMDDSGDPELCVFSALLMPAHEWRSNLEIVRRFRRELRKQYGIYVYKEMHAWKFVSGRGRISNKVVTKFHRCQIFRESLQLITTLKGVHLFNAVFNRGQSAIAFERIVNRINRTLLEWESYGLLICDAGNEPQYTRLVRKMGRFNPIPSMHGTWRDTGTSHKNIPIDRIVEDPWFKDSTQSYFIQLVDFAAFSLLCKENPKFSRTRHGINEAWQYLKPILFTGATRYDKEGILRPQYD